jgi:hypothetical protein
MLWTLYSLNKKVDRIMVDLAKLQAAVARLVADVELVIPLVSDPAAAAQLQSTADALTATLDAESVKVEALKAPAPTATPGT